MGRPDDYTADYLTILGPLEKILLVAGDYDDDGRLLPSDTEELQARANDYRAEYTRFIKLLI